MAAIETSEPLQTRNVPGFDVEFSWKKWNILITDDRDPESNPIYTVDFQKSMKAPHFLFKSAPDHRTIGSGTIHTFSINAEYELHGYKDTLLAQKRWQTVYTYQSRAFSETSTPVTLTWSSSSGFKTWDVVCINENQEMVARFTANIWALKKIGKIEFLGAKAESDAAREEIVITGLTLFYCTMVRSCSILSLLGAVLASPGQQKDTSSGRQRKASN